jgi:hypothetical protein
MSSTRRLVEDGKIVPGTTLGGKNSMETMALHPPVANFIDFLARVIADDVLGRVRR